MDEMEQAHKELERLQRIIDRHEGHMFALRGWLLATIGGLLAAYYTDNVEMSALALRLALVAIALAFLVVESRHVNLVEAVVERVGALEKLMADSRRSAQTAGWYDGPKVNATCRVGARRLWPRSGMTFALNQAFYVVIIVVVVVTTVSLPAKRAAPAQAAASSQPASR